jgi:hypothetical protein
LVAGSRRRLCRGTGLSRSSLSFSYDEANHRYQQPTVPRVIESSMRFDEPSIRLDTGEQRASRHRQLNRGGFGGAAAFSFAAIAGSSNSFCAQGTSLARSLDRPRLRRALLVSHVCLVVSCSPRGRQNQGASSRSRHLRRAQRRPRSRPFSPSFPSSPATARRMQTITTQVSNDRAGAASRSALTVRHRIASLGPEMRRRLRLAAVLSRSSCCFLLAWTAKSDGDDDCCSPTARGMPLFHRLPSTSRCSLCSATPTAEVRQQRSMDAAEQQLLQSLRSCLTPVLLFLL